MRFTTRPCSSQPLIYQNSLDEYMALVLRNISVAFQELGTSVTRALHTQIGDAARLNEEKRRCLQFLADIRQVS